MNAGTRLLVPAGFAWLAAWLAVGLPSGGAGALANGCWMLAAIALAVAGAVAVRARTTRAEGAVPAARSSAVRAGGGRPTRWVIAWGPLIAVTAAAAALVAASAATGAAARTGSPLAEAAEGHGVVEAVVELVAAPRAAPDFGFGGGPVPSAAGASTSGDPDPGSEPRRVQVDGRLRAVEGRSAAGIPVLLVATLSAGPDLAFGASVRARVRVAALEPSGSAAYRLTAPEGADVTLTPPPPWLAWSGGLRSGFSAAASELGGDAGALVPGLAIGDTALVSDELDAAMRAASLSHLTAVSGANCVLVTAGFLVLGAALRLPRAARLVLAALALVAFVVLVTPESSVVRAATMSLVVLLGLGLGRGAGGTAALGLAVLVLLFVDPWFARDYGFALSVLATAGLLLLSAPLARRLSAWMPEPIALALAVPLAAQLACQPVLVLLDPAIAGLGVVANLLAGPAAPIGTVVGMLACLLLPVLPGPAAWLLDAATLPAGWIAGVAHAVAGLPVNRVPWVPGALGALLLTAGSLAALHLLLAPGGPARGRRRVGGRPRLRLLSALVVLGALVLPLAALIGGPALTRLSRPGDWQLAQCDIGQGDAVLLRSAGRTALIDTGPDPAALARCRTLLGVDRVDLLVLTHWDADHVGGVAAVLGDVGTVLVGPADGARSARVVEPLRAGGARVVPAAAGLAGELGGLGWRVLWPEDVDAPPGNASSLVMEIAGDGWHGVFLGDLGEDAQRELLRGGMPEHVDVVKVAHHGSGDQAAPLYERLRATIGLIGVGADNGYGHPTARLLGLLDAAGTRALRSDRLGTLVLHRTAAGFALWSERGGVGGGP